MGLEARGAKAILIFAGGLDFSGPVEKFFIIPITKRPSVNSVVSWTGFALVGVPARRDHPKAVEALAKLDVPSHCKWHFRSLMEVDNRVYEEANAIFIQDEEMLNKSMNTNPNSFRKLVQTFLEANGRGYWESSELNMAKLRQLYSEVEDKIEGIDR